MDKLVLIDGNSLFNRAFYATPIFSTKDGQPTNAIFGFVKLLFKILNDQKPEYLIVTFDLKAPTFRHKMYDGYKATRKPMCDELAAQVQPLKTLLAAMNIATCEKEGFEADDLIGTLSNKFDVHSYIYTGDRDSFQLIDEKTDVYYTKRGVSDLLKLSLENFKSEVGLEPPQIVDLKALMGDKSDNIPGVAGIGEMTARKLIEEYGSLNGVYENIDAIKSASTRNKLVENKDMAYLSYKLATIDRNCELDIDLKNCKTPQSYSTQVRDLFEKLEFNSLINLLQYSVGGSSEKQDTFKYPEILEVEKRAEFAAVCKNIGEFYIDLNKDGIKLYDGDKQYNVKFEAEDLLCELSYAQCMEELRSVFENLENKVICYDCKQLMHVCDSFNIEFACEFEDISVMGHVADYLSESKNLQETCVLHGYDEEYSAYVLSKLYADYKIIMARDGLEKLYFEVEKPLIYVLYDMEKCGVKVDISVLDRLGEKYSDRIKEISEKIFELSDKCFNLNSPTQLGEVLYEKFGLQAVKKKKTGKFSTSAEILEELAPESEVVRLVLEYRFYQKLYSTYVEGFKPIIDKKTGLVHTTYNQTVTSTGRLSSTNPNLQNIPIRDENGKELRKVFVPHEGCIFIDADYSQIELRLLAHFSGCKELISAYENGEDIHAFTASQVFGVPISEVTPKMRRNAKAVNFGIIYGMSEFGLSKSIGTDLKTAKEYIEKYFERYSAVKEYMESNVEFAKKNGYVATLTGRRRYIKEINSANYNLRQFGERAAMNMPLQGSSADIIKIAMVNIERVLREKNLKSKLILQVHDELVLESPVEEKEIAEQILKNGMENAFKLKVPLSVEVHSGTNWYEAK